MVAIINTYNKSKPTIVYTEKNEYFLVYHQCFGTNEIGFIHKSNLELFRSKVIMFNNKNEAEKYLTLTTDIHGRWLTEPFRNSYGSILTRPYNSTDSFETILLKDARLYI